MALNKNYLVQRLYRYKNRYTIQKDQPKKLRFNIMKNNLKTATEEADIFMDWISGIDGSFGSKKKSPSFLEVNYEQDLPPAIQFPNDVKGDNLRKPDEIRAEVYSRGERDNNFQNAAGIPRNRVRVGVSGERKAYVGVCRLPNGREVPSTLDNCERLRGRFRMKPKRAKLR